MKMIIPPSVGILVAGVASGICYLLIGSLRKGKGEKLVSFDDSRCACCLKPFLIGRGVECNDCGARSCRKACCRWDNVENSWFCLFCYHNRTWTKRREKWFRSFGGLPVEPENSNNFSTAKCRVYDEGAEHVAIHTELDLAAGGRKERDSMETVREFVERIVEGLVGNVDDTPIDRLYDHQAYDRLFETHAMILAGTLTRLSMSLRQCIDNKPATDTPTMVHTALRDLVERAVDEARKLPCLGPTVSTTGSPDDTSYSEQNYEDLLATAILNKVIEKYQSERIDGNSNVVHRRTRSKYTKNDSEIGLDEGVEEGSSSLEPLSQDEGSSDGSGSRTRRICVRQDPISLTIEEQIEEVVTTYGSDEDIGSSKTNVLDFRKSRRVPFPEFGMDIVDPSQDSSEESEDDSKDLHHVDVITPVESWEENWLFQRRKIKTQSEPVSMLVPNPSADYRALIGDKDAEDTSDLSEFSAQSDDEIEDDEELTQAINRSITKLPKVPDISLDERIIDNQTIEILSEKRIDERDFERQDFDNLSPQGDEKKFRIYEKLELPEEKRDNGDSGLSESSYDPGKSIMKNHDVPKTPSSSPLRSSLTENAPEVRSTCDFQQLNDKLISIDKKIDEESIENCNSLARFAVINDEIIDHKIVEANVLSSDEVIEDLKPSPVNGFHQIISQECLETKSSVDECDSGANTILEKSSNDEIKANGFVQKICPETITNGTSMEEIESRYYLKTNDVSDLETSRLRKFLDAEIELATPPRPGTIAEREHKKWENAAPIENNPYSEENIQKRLLERQYSRRSSDVSGNSSKLQTSPSPPLQIVLGAGRPDSKRFGRDYYINEAKSPNGRSTETGFFTATSRPESSMSQNSLSTGSDYEHQERSRSVETESTCSTSSDSITKIYENREAMRELSKDGRIEKSANDNSENSINKILESERKNNKNEINARLNNHGNSDEIVKPIKRIDLRSYGFENEFNVKNGDKFSSMAKMRPIVNKLDLRYFGYYSGLRRTQSINNIDDDARLKFRSCRSKDRNIATKSNLIEQSVRRFSGESRDDLLTKSTESINGESPKNLGKLLPTLPMKSAKSVPNIRELFSRIDEKEIEHRKDKTNFDKGNIREIGKIDDSKNHHVSRIDNGDTRTEKKSAMPSVRILAQAFSKTEKKSSQIAQRSSKNSNTSSKERPTTPEIHIVDTPRQMHSLTARSISREFREGLRQISSKQISTTRKKFISEEKHRTPEVSMKTTSKIATRGETSAVPGKLKNNIQFWEQMHRNS